MEYSYRAYFFLDLSTFLGFLAAPSVIAGGYYIYGLILGLLSIFYLCLNPIGKKLLPSSKIYRVLVFFGFPGLIVFAFVANHYKSFMFLLFLLFLIYAFIFHRVTRSNFR